LGGVSGAGFGGDVVGGVAAGGRGAGGVGGCWWVRGMGTGPAAGGLVVVG